MRWQLIAMSVPFFSHMPRPGWLLLRFQVDVARGIKVSERRYTWDAFELMGNACVSLFDDTLALTAVRIRVCTRTCMILNATGIRATHSLLLLLRLLLLLLLLVHLCPALCAPMHAYTPLSLLQLCTKLCVHLSC
jgi:hypothetical protein